MQCFFSYTPQKSIVVYYDDSGVGFRHFLYLFIYLVLNETFSVMSVKVLRYDNELPQRAISHA